jgi:cytochrome c7-like protein
LSLSGAARDQPFHHKKHASLKLKCVSCHKNAEQAERAGFPEITQCKACHLDMSTREIPSQRIYELPDFVFFSHASHAAAKVECTACHGNVAIQETITLNQPLKMKWCVDCHKQSHAAVRCNTCHELGQ